MEIRRATVDDEPAILALTRQTLGWTDDHRFVELYQWKHDRNPFGRSPRWIAVDDGEVVGFRAFLRWRFRRGDETVDAVRAVDTATDPAFQGRGIFRALTLHAVEEMTAEGVGFVFNTPNDQSRPGYLKMGWSVLGAARVGVLPRLRSVPTVVRARVPADLWGEPTAVGRDVAEALEVWSGGAAHGPVVEDDDRRWRTDHTVDVLRWRYGLDALGYRAMPTTGDPEVGLALFRVRRRGPAREAVVADVLGPASGAPVHPADRRRALRKILRDTGADHLLVATDRAVDTTPVLAVPGLGPTVTVRPLAAAPPRSFDDLALSMGDLELF